MGRGRGTRSAVTGARGIAEVHALNHDGRGVARVDGKAVFIDGALPGEQVEYECLKGRRRYDNARVINVIRPSPDRIHKPRCTSFGLCGGCSLQHFDPAAQIRAKQQILLDNLARIGRVVPAQVFAPVDGPLWGYRRRARLGVRLVTKKDTVLVGFREKASSYLADMPACEVLVPQVGHRLLELRALVGQLSCPDCVPQLEVAAGDESVALVFRHLVELAAQDRELLRQFGAQHGFQIWLQPGAPATAAALYPDPAPPLSYRLPEQEITLQFLPTDFVQVNGEINRKVVNRAIELLEPGPADHVLDLFCGLGNFTLPLARHAASVTGIEGDAGLIDRARHNADLNGIDNASFAAIDLDDPQAGAIANPGRWNRVLLDPPRTGAMEVVKQLVRVRPERIVYVSCNPATLARDSAVLVNAGGYSLTGAGVLDMFPHTNHVESIALFTR